MSQRVRIGFAIVAVLALVVAVALHVTQRQDPIELQEAAVDYVVDGDTIDVIADGQEIRVRLIGIDSPESASHNAEENTVEGAYATEFVRQLLPQGRTVYLQSDEEDVDKYGRSLRYVWLQVPDDPRNSDEVATKMANALIVEAGYADTYPYWPNTTYEDQFEAAKKRAIAANAGIAYLWN